MPSSDTYTDLYVDAYVNAYGVLVMAKTSGLGDNFYIGGYDLSGDVSSIDTLATPRGVFDVTAIKQSANERIFGQRAGDMQFTSFFSMKGTITAPGFPLTTVPVTNTFGVPIVVTITGGTVTNVAINGVTAGTGDGTYILPYLGTIAVTYTGSPSWAWLGEGRAYDALSVLPRSDVAATYFRGTTLLNATACCIGKQINFDPTRDNTGNLTLKAEVQSNGYGLEWGKMLTAGLRSDSAATAGAFVDDNGAGTTFGAQAYLQLVEFVGTSVDVTIQHCTTSGGSYSTLIDFGAQTAIGSFRVAAAGTVNRYLEVVTTGTFTLATFAVGWMRNPAAVVF
jgi:hypothetical protein